jgi:hypothetical protein
MQHPHTNSDRESFVDLPPCNSFCRMLTHKLADYYHMTHQFDVAAGSVRIFRTPFCRLPVPLTVISNTSTRSSPPIAVAPIKIMRRGDGTSNSASKTASEADSDEKDKNLSYKEKYIFFPDLDYAFLTGADCQGKSAKRLIKLLGRGFLAQRLLVRFLYDSLPHI